jgi:hypothetical protein
MKTTKSTAQLSTLVPLLAVGIVVILCVAIISSYVYTTTMINTVIIPGGTTYIGK